MPLPELTRADAERYSRHLLLSDVGVEGQRRLQGAHIGRFKPLCDFDWQWP